MLRARTLLGTKAAACHAPLGSFVSRIRSPRPVLVAFTRKVAKEIVQSAVPAIIQGQRLPFAANAQQDLTAQVNAMDSRIFRCRARKGSSQEQGLPLVRPAHLGPTQCLMQVHVLPVVEACSVTQPLDLFRVLEGHSALPIVRPAASALRGILQTRRAWHHVHHAPRASFAKTWGLSSRSHVPQAGSRTVGNPTAQSVLQAHTLGAMLRAANHVLPDRTVVVRRPCLQNARLGLLPGQVLRSAPIVLLVITPARARAAAIPVQLACVVQMVLNRTHACLEPSLEALHRHVHNVSWDSIRIEVSLTDATHAPLGIAAWTRPCPSLARLGTIHKGLQRAAQLAKLESITVSMLGRRATGVLQVGSAHIMRPHFQKFVSLASFRLLARSDALHAPTARIQIQALGHVNHARLGSTARTEWALSFARQDFSQKGMPWTVRDARWDPTAR